MKIECGPKHDLRIFELNLPNFPYIDKPWLEKLWMKTNNFIKGNKIGCLVSGGADSALLYFLMLEENRKTGNKYEIIPYTILRIGAKKPAQNVINWIHKFYNIPEIQLNIIGDPDLPEIQQVNSGIFEILGSKVDYVYLGIIADRPEHYINWDNVKFEETVQRKYPFLNLEKSHIIDLYYKKKLKELFDLTRSCNIGEDEPCGHCNGCMARIWGIEQIQQDRDIKLN